MEPLCEFHGISACCRILRVPTDGAVHGTHIHLHRLPAALCQLRGFSRVLLFMTPWTAARQTPLSMAFSRQELLERVAMPSSRGSSWPRDRTHVSYISYTVGRLLTPEPLGSMDFPQQENWGIQSLQLGSSLIHSWALPSEHYIWCLEEVNFKTNFSEVLRVLGNKNFSSFIFITAITILIASTFILTLSHCKSASHAHLILTSQRQGCHLSTSYWWGIQDSDKWPKVWFPSLAFSPAGNAFPLKSAAPGRIQLYLVTNTAASTGGVSSLPPGTWLLPRYRAPPYSSFCQWQKLSRDRSPWCPMDNLA